MQSDSRAEIEELLRRLTVSAYCDSDIREAAEVVAAMLTHAESQAMGQEFLASTFAQVQKLGIGLLEAIAPKAPKARAVLDRPEVRAQKQKLFGTAPPDAAPAAAGNPGYAAMAEIIRMWIREEKNREPKQPQDWSPRI